MNGYQIGDIVYFRDDLNQKRAGIIAGFPVIRDKDGYPARGVQIETESTHELYTRDFEDVEAIEGE